MPVMEGRRCCSKEFAGVDAFPLCIDTNDVDQIIALARAAGLTIGRVNLENNLSATLLRDRRFRCELDVPVFTTPSTAP